MPVLPAVSPTEVSALLKQSTPPRLLDVREPPEYVSELGHIEGAELVPLGSLQQNVAKFQGETREIVCICRSGMRSQQAAGLLGQLGFSTRNMTGGMLAWNSAQLPISKAPPK